MAHKCLDMKIYMNISMPYFSMIISFYYVVFFTMGGFHYTHIIYDFKIVHDCLLFSWKHVHILSLMSFESPMPDFLMVVLCLHFSTLNRKYVSSCQIELFYW
jgi:hypothetical protein